MARNRVSRTSKQRVPSAPKSSSPLLLIPTPRPQTLLPLYSWRARPSTVSRDWLVEDYYSDKSRIVFCSSFRRLMEKAQVFSLESNTSVRNRLTHSIEVADIGRTLARNVGKRLQDAKLATEEDVESVQTIVESACLIHDIGNPAFGHFGEEAIKSWFRRNATALPFVEQHELPLGYDAVPRLNDFWSFDGNPQGFRIVTRLHCEIDEHALNLTASTLLASVKYPNCGVIAPDARFPKKLGIFSSEADVYARLIDVASIRPGRRYFLAYLMELADDICYCLSDIADSFEKRVTTSREFKAELKKISAELHVDDASFIPRDPIINFGYQVGIPVARRLIREAATQFVANFDAYLSGDAGELADALPSGRLLKCFKLFARRFIYTNREVERIEIAGARVVEGLLDHFGRLLKLSRSDFSHFVTEREMLKARGLDTEWRIFDQLSPRMLRVYQRQSRGCSDAEELICRARLIIDYIAGMTDDSALTTYQNFMGIRL